jgi:hypothetical protein
MPAWTKEDLAKVGNAEELGIASRRPDGSLRRWVTIWVVRVGDEIYIRSAAGPDNPWFRRALASGNGRIRAGGVEQEVTFESPPATLSTASLLRITRSTIATGRASSGRSCHRSLSQRPSGSCHESDRTAGLRGGVAAAHSLTP